MDFVVSIPITLITTGILGGLFFVHSLRTIMGRALTNTNLGDGGNEVMLRRIRIHGNFAEYIPLLLFILLLLELHMASGIFLVSYAVAIVGGRLLHFYGLYAPETNGRARVLGMQLTLWPLILGSLYVCFLGIHSFI